MNLRILVVILLLHQTLAQSGFDTSGCGKTKHCISVPANCHEHSTDQCQYMISYEPFTDGKSVFIELFGMRNPAIQYVAVGFSDDAEMGGEAVEACALAPNGKVELTFSYNNGKSNQPNVGVDASDAHLLDSVATDDVIYCKFQQAITPANEALPNFNTPYQLLVARGPRMENGQLGYHSDRQAIPALTNFLEPLGQVAANPPVEGASSVAPSAPGSVVFPNQTSNVPSLQGPRNDNPEGVDSKNNGNRPTKFPAQNSGLFAFSSATRLTLVKYHGFLMLLAWFAMIAIGIFSARYLRPGTPNTKVGGLHLWFQLHRGINFSAVIIILAATILIFVANNLRWAGPVLGAEPGLNWSSSAIHTLFGVIAIILALMQPLGALARCGPDHPRRPLFNWGHRILGLVAIIFALIATFIAINGFHVWSNKDLPTALIVLYIIVAVFLVIALEVFAFARARSRRKVTINGMEMSSRSKYGQDGFESVHHSGNERSKMDKLVDVSGFLLFAVISIAFVILLTLFLL